jgi:hypothetical protein
VNVQPLSAIEEINVTSIARSVFPGATLLAAQKIDDQHAIVLLDVQSRRYGRFSTHFVTYSTGAVYSGHYFDAIDVVSADFLHRVSDYTRTPRSTWTVQDGLDQFITEAEARLLDGNR